MNTDLKSTSKKKSLLMNAGILAAAGIVSRVIGLLYGSPLAAIIGDEGNGYYAAAYAIYTIILLVSSYSIPSAMSKIISARLAVGEFKNAQKIFKCALIYVTVVGFVGSLVLFFGADFLATGRAAVVLKFFAPTIFIYGFLGVLRGYFQANKTMVPTSVSLIIEQIFNAIVSVGGAYILTKMAGEADPSRRAMYGAIGSALGTGSGVLIALLFMLHIYYGNRREIRNRLESDHTNVLSYRRIFSLIFFVVTPFILSTCIYNLSTFLNSTLFSRILMNIRGLDEVDVASMYGIFSRKAMVITNLPIAFASAAASAMIPEISGSYARGDKEAAGETISKVTKAILIIAIPCAAGLFFLARPVMMILFPQRVSIVEASILLRCLAITVVFYSLSTVSNAVLQGIGRVNMPVINALIALVLQTATLSLLLLFTDLNGYALCIVTIVYSLAMCVLNGLSLKKNIKAKNDIKKTYVLPSIAAIVMGLFAVGTYRLVTYIVFTAGKTKDIHTVPVDMVFADYIYSDYFVNLFATMVSVFVAMIVYFAVLFRIGGASNEEIKRLPKGASVYRVLKKLHVVR